MQIQPDQEAEQAQQPIQKIQKLLQDLRILGGPQVSASRQKAIEYFRNPKGMQFLIEVLAMQVEEKTKQLSASLINNLLIEYAEEEWSEDELVKYITSIVLHTGIPHKIKTLLLRSMSFLAVNSPPFAHSLLHLSAAQLSLITTLDLSQLDLGWKTLPHRPEQPALSEEQLCLGSMLALQGCGPMTAREEQGVSVVGAIVDCLMEVVVNKGKGNLSILKGALDLCEELLQVEMQGDDYLSLVGRISQNPKFYIFLYLVYSMGCPQGKSFDMKQIDCDAERREQILELKAATCKVHLSMLEVLQELEVSPQQFNQEGFESIFELTIAKYNKDIPSDAQLYLTVKTMVLLHAYYVPKREFPLRDALKKVHTLIFPLVHRVLGHPPADVEKFKQDMQQSVTLGEGSVLYSAALLLETLCQNCVELHPHLMEMVQRDLKGSQDGFGRKDIAFWVLHVVGSMGVSFKINHLLTEELICSLEGTQLAMLWFWIEQEGNPSDYVPAHLFLRLTQSDLPPIAKWFGYSCLSRFSSEFAGWELLIWAVEGLLSQDEYSKFRWRFVAKQTIDHGHNIPQKEACQIVQALREGIQNGIKTKQSTFECPQRCLCQFLGIARRISIHTENLEGKIRLQEQLLITMKIASDILYQKRLGQSKSEFLLVGLANDMLYFFKQWQKLFEFYLENVRACIVRRKWRSDETYQFFSHWMQQNPKSRQQIGGMCNVVLMQQVHHNPAICLRVFHLQQQELILYGDSVKKARLKGLISLNECIRKQTSKQTTLEDKYMWARSINVALLCLLLLKEEPQLEEVIKYVRIGCFADEDARMLCFLLSQFKPTQPQKIHQIAQYLLHFSAYYTSQQQMQSPSIIGSLLPIQEPLQQHIRHMLAINGLAEPCHINRKIVKALAPKSTGSELKNVTTMSARKRTLEQIGMNLSSDSSQENGSSRKQLEGQMNRKRHKHQAQYC